MFRRFAGILCLALLAPTAVCAQGIPIAASPVAAVDTVSDNALPSGREFNLSLVAGNSATVTAAVTESSEGTAAITAPESKKESRRSFNWGNFAEVHLGDYRWVWWVGAAAVLIAIHAGAD